MTAKKTEKKAAEEVKEPKAAELFEQAQGQAPVEVKEEKQPEVKKAQKDDKEYISLFNDYVKLYGFMPKDSWSKTDLKVLIENKQYETETLEIQEKQAEENRILEEKKRQEEKEIEQLKNSVKVTDGEKVFTMSKKSWEAMDGKKGLKIVNDDPEDVKALKNGSK